MKKRQPNPRIFMIMSLATLAAGAALSYFEWNNYQEQQGKIAALKKEGIDAKSVETQLAQTEEQLVQLQKDLAHLERGVPQFAYVPTMLKELEQTGKSHGIAVLGVRPVPKAVSGPKDPDEKKKPERKPYQELDIEVKGRGKFGDVLSFVSALNQFPKVVAARTVSIEPKVQTKDNIAVRSLEVTVLLRAYLFKEQPKSSLKTAKGPTVEVRRDG